MWMGSWGHGVWVCSALGFSVGFGFMGRNTNNIICELIFRVSTGYPWVKYTIRTILDTFRVSDSTRPTGEFLPISMSIRYENRGYGYPRVQLPSLTRTMMRMRS
jgi:hypothetical protein